MFDAESIKLITKLANEEKAKRRQRDRFRPHTRQDTSDYLAAAEKVFYMGLIAYNPASWRQPTPQLPLETTMPELAGEHGGG